MAHHRQKRSTSKAENKRLDHKKQRSAEAQALRGDHLRIARGMSWGVKLAQGPILDEHLPHKKMKRRQRPKKERCPVNRTHQWYKEVITEVSPWWYYPERVWWSRDREAFRTIDVYRLDTCIHCWKSRKKRISYRYEYK